MSPLNAVSIAVLTVALVACLATGAAVGQTGGQQQAQDGQPKQQASGGKPPMDFFFNWLNMPGMQPFAPLFKPLQDTVGPMTQSMSQNIANTVPGAQQVYNQMDSITSQIGQLTDPSQLVGALTNPGQIMNQLNPTNLINNLNPSNLVNGLTGSLSG